MPVDEYFTEMFRGMAAARAAGGGDEEREALAAAFVEEYRTAGTEDWDTTGIDVEDLAVEGPHGPVPVRVYRPRSPSGALLWAHGGGFRYGDIDMVEGHVVSIELARRAAVTVASVDYRLAEGEVNRYPVPIDDVAAAWDWLCAGDLAAGGPVASGGASAGAALALSAALRARDTGARLPDALLLAYPFAHYPNPALSPASSAEMAALPFRFEAEGVDAMVRNYVGRISDVPADALPGAARLDGLPRTLIMIDEYDDLRSSAELLERQLREVGVPVESYLARGMTHGHLNHSPKVAEVGRSLDFFADALRS